MEDVKDKLGYLSFAEKAWQELEKSLTLLRDVKKKFCSCAANCFDKPEVQMSSWKEVRLECLKDCQSVHDQIFNVFNSSYQKTREDSVKCIYQCHSEYAISKFGEEDQTICEEKCYESFYIHEKQINESLSEEYKKVYLEKFSNN